MAPSDLLLKLAVQAAVDQDAIPVLGDALIEAGWRDDRVMALCLGVPLDPMAPDDITTDQGRQAWRRRRERSLEMAAGMWVQYAGHRSDWARGVLAVMLFDGWAPARPTPLFGSRCPYLLVWRNATAYVRERANERRRRRRARERELGDVTAAEELRARGDAFWSDPARPR